MISWLLIVSLLGLEAGRGNGLEKGLCGPQVVTLSSSDQTLLLTWEDQPSCSELNESVVYELLVLIADKQQHHENVEVTPDLMGSTHSWTWTSLLPLECADHSVWLRSRNQNQTSPWVKENLLPGNRSPTTFKVFPRDGAFEVGSSATFCCVVPAGQSFDQMYLSGFNGENMISTRISNQTFALTVSVNQASDTWIDVKCKTNTTTYGTSAGIGYPPEDRDLQCETQDLKSVDCRWTVGRNTQFWSRPEYHLQGSPCPDGSKGRCSLKTPVEAGETNWTLTSSNRLGRIELHDRADLTQRVRLFAPEEVTASAVNSRNVSLKWRWTVEEYEHLSLTCEVRGFHGETSSTSESSGVGLNSAVLTDLKPNWTYEVTVRCRTESWRWGDWSRGAEIHTRTDVPDPLDVWMQMMENQVVVVWKTPLANQSHGEITGYEVTWANTTTRLPHSKHNYTLCLDTGEEHVVTVTAWNINGSSSPSAVTIPNMSPDRTKVNSSWITGSNGSFMLSWPLSPASSCGYIIDWCPTLRCQTVDWIKVPANNTNVTIFSKDFRDGQRYSLSVYACTEGAPVLLERREGYAREIRIKKMLFKSLKVKQQETDAEISWERIPLREQPAFIRGFTLYYWTKDSTVFSVSTDDPEATSLTATNLEITSYTFMMAARTALGECGNSSIIVTLNSLTDDLFQSIFIALGLVLGLLTLTTVLCYRNWACIKHKVYPPIPKPVLMDNWLTSAVHLDLCREADVSVVPELHPKPGVSGNEYVSEAGMPFSFTQTPKGYYNKPLKKNSPPLLILPYIDAPSPSGPPSSPFRGVFPNPSYDPIPGDHWFRPQLLEGTPSIQTSDGYQPQNQAETSTLTPTVDVPHGPDTSMSCESAYILLPQLPST